MSTMAKTFREWNPEQAVMFPPTALDLVERDDLVHFVRNLVLEQLDLSEITGAAVARLIGLDPPLPSVTIEVDRDGAPGVTGGRTITLSEAWFREHPDDVGCVLHELTHAYMLAPDYDASTIWLIEGLADHVRDVLGFDTSWTFAHFEPGKATAGYQTTADLLAWLEERHPGAVAALSRRLADGTYREAVFAEVAGAPLPELVAAYEADRNLP